MADEDAKLDCIRLNRAFHGWGHQFLYNRATLAAALRSAGFANDGLPHLRRERPARSCSGLERHETWEDTPDLPHVLIVEASGQAEPGELDAKELKEFREAIGTK